MFRASPIAELALADRVLCATATLREIGTATIDATLRVPSRPFDVKGWRALDIRAIKGATATLDEITVDDKIAKRFGLGGLRGRIGALITPDTLAYVTGGAAWQRIKATATCDANVPFPGGYVIASRTDTQRKTMPRWNPRRGIGQEPGAAWNRRSG